MTSTAYTVGDYIRAAADQFECAQLEYGHGTSNALDDAAYLVFAKLGLSHDAKRDGYAKKLSAADRHALDALVAGRCLVSWQLP